MRKQRSRLLLLLAALGFTAAGCASGPTVKYEGAARSELAKSLRVYVLHAGAEEMSSGQRAVADTRSELEDELQRVIPKQLAPSEATASLLIDFQKSDLMQCFHCDQYFDRWHWRAFLFDTNRALLATVEGTCEKRRGSAERAFGRSLKKMLSPSH